MSEIRYDIRLPETLPDVLPVIPLRKGALLPGGVLPMTLTRASSNAAALAARDLVLVAAQREAVETPHPSDLYPIAILARIVERPNSQSLVVLGLARVRLSGFPATAPYLKAAFQVLKPGWPASNEAAALAAAIKQSLQETTERIWGSKSSMASLPHRIGDPALLVDAIAWLLETSPDWKRQQLLNLDPLSRGQDILQELARLREVRDAQESIQKKVKEEVGSQHREAVLRHQLKAIQDELGEGDKSDDLQRLRQKLADAALPEEVREVVDRELKRLERIHAQSPERSVALDWLEWVAEMPWGASSAVDVDLNALEDALKRSHHGLNDIKRQVLEHLAVRKLAGNGRADVLLLHGPPGVGKTSIGQAIADATGRKLVRVALGGVRDESTLRGHRRTYIGARPGRLVEGIRRAGTRDPVVLLDEIDKLGRGYQGDPASALLEILDPEQNHAFTDHYLDVPFDLSHALFIATANDLTTIPPPLLDRMEILEIAGYSAEEKRVIAKDHLWEKLARNAGLEPSDVEVAEDVVEDVIQGWTREAGVRQLQRALGRLFRAAAVKKARGELVAPLKISREDLSEFLGKRRLRPEERHEESSRPGVVTGLAWTPAGGDVLYVEADVIPGKGNLILTGQLGDVMKESARAALTYVMSHRASIGISDQAAEGVDVHIHVPAGAVPKDGPSAGVTMFTALASLFSGRAVWPGLAMTGEATLRGRVLPVGGIKSKVLAAHARGIQVVILPKANAIDLEEVPETVRSQMRFVLVEHMDEVLAAALETRGAAVLSVA